MSDDIETRRAPVQGFSAGIPWSVHCKAYDGYVARYGNTQSAETLAARGGFGVGELDKFYPDWRRASDEITKLRTDRDSLRKALDDRWAADLKAWKAIMRATGKERGLPDNKEVIAYLVAEMDRLENELSILRRRLGDDNGEP